MSRLLRFALLCLGLFAAGNTAMAQRDADNDDGRRAGYWFLGLNAGGAWQQSDIKARPGGGLGFYLGGNIFYRKTSPISLDLRFRYLYTSTYGQDWQRTYVMPSEVLGGNFYDNSFFGNGISSSKNYSTSGGGLGYAFMNNNTDFHDLSLELRLNFENLRRKHRIWFSLYGGAGVGLYNTFFDQLDSRTNAIDPSLYAYENINTTGSRSAVTSDLEAFRDDDYETNVSNGYQASLMLHGGFELGYWITPRFAMGIGHRVTWTMQDDFDGYAASVRTRKDIHHYANLFMHFDLYGGRARVNNNTNNNVNNNTNINTNIVSAPRVVFSFPSACPYTVQNGVATIRVNISDVNSAANINFTVNGTRVTDFRYNTTTGVLEATIALVVGSNNIFVQASNTGGTASASCNIVYSPVEVVKNPPTVNITYPSNGLTVNNNIINVTAIITNINSASQVTYTVNGVPSRNFTLNGTSFVANNTILQAGSNTIVVSATNPDGSASDSRVVIYSQPQPDPVIVQNPPTVQITNPANNPFYTNNNLVGINATTTNINNAGQITFVVNGQPTRSFNFSGNRITATGIRLVQGSNTVSITVTNADGSATDSRTIIYEVPQPDPVIIVQNPPTVQITNPSANPYTTNTNVISLTAVTTNISNASQITFLVNGQITRNFSFSGNRINANAISLIQGNNLITITVTNADGSASDNTTIIYQMPQPPVVQNPPTVQITNPAQDPLNTTANTVNITATTTNIIRHNQVTFTVNGSIIQNFAFNNGIINAANLPLQQGANVVVIRVQNNDGTAVDQTIINYTQPAPPCLQPTVNVNTNNNVNSASANINAAFSHISAASQINFSVNGQPVTQFNFNAANGMFTAIVNNLQAGANNFVLTATNNCGTVTERFTVNYNRQSNPPTVNITNPAQDPFNTNSNTANINATITNVTGVNQVTFTVNGQASRNFGLRGNNFSAGNVALQQGNNVVVITATNNDGTASDQTTIIYALPCQQPTIALTAPASRQSNTNVQAANINANITGISTVSQITFKVNGMTNKKFTFNNANFVSTGNNLRVGANTFEIIVQNDCGTATESFTINYAAPCTQPTIDLRSPAANVNNVNSPVTNINAAFTGIDNANQITLTMNGQAVREFNYNAQSGTLVSTINNLQAGANTFVITATNACGTATVSFTVNFTRQSNPPTVNITSPNQNPFNTNSATANINATITNVTSANQVTFTVNGQTSRNFGLRGNNFSASNAALQQGNNTIVITATNDDGTASDQTVINYSAPCERPTITLRSPAANVSNVNSPVTNINAAFTGITNPNEITLTMNGQAIREFNYNSQSSTLVSTVNNLQQGSNTFVITATNACGTTTVTFTVNFTRQSNPPTVNITNPNQNPFNTNSATANVTANTTNVSNANQVTVTVNGQAVTNFGFRGNSVVLSNIALRQGNNTISITVTNEDGTATDQTVINYSAPVANPPTVNITSPNQNPFNSPTQQATINATITNVANRSNVTFRVNGSNVNNFNFSGNNFSASGITLNQGDNTFEITATNDDGTATDQTVIIYKATVRPPTITVTSPMQNPYITTSNTVNITANTTLVANANDVTFTVNGRRVNNFSFSNNVFTANNVALEPGGNNIIITVVNGGGAANATFTVAYDNSGSNNGGNNGGTNGGNMNRTRTNGNGTNNTNQNTNGNKATDNKTTTPTDNKATDNKNNKIGGQKNTTGKDSTTTEPNKNTKIGGKKDNE